MEKKLKKQRKKLIFRITAILISVWLILSAAYAAIALNNEKDHAANEAQIAFSVWLKNVEPYSREPVLFLDDIRKTATVENRSDNPAKSKITYTYDRNVNMVIGDFSSSVSYDSDDIIDITLTAEIDSPEYREPFFGYISFKRFRDSITDEQYEKILDYLDHQPEGDEYYELLATDFCQNSDSELILKAVQIVKTSEVNKWYVQDTPVETFALKPTGTDHLTVYHISYQQRNALPKEFVRDSFGSSGLVKEAQDLAEQQAVREEQDETLSLSCLLKVGAFEYIYYDVSPFTANIIAFKNDYPDTDREPLLSDAITYSYGKPFEVCYAKRLNILDNCIGNILIAVGIMLAFFVMIGVLLNVMMQKSMKVHLLEEQKRTDMVNTLAHDIKTPLFILSGYAGNLKENVQTDKRDHYADVIVEQAQEVNRRVNRMLELSKLDSEDLEPDLQEFDLKEPVREILSFYEVLPDDKSISFSADDGPCTVTADRGLMKRAIENLIDNAVKYADPDSLIHVTLSGGVFSVSNCCSSMDESELTERINSSKTAYKPSSAFSSGSGLGISITKAVIALHGFELSHTAENHTVTFRIKLSAK